MTGDPASVDRSRRRRADNYEARRALHQISALPRVRKCGRTPVTADGSVALRVTEKAGRRVAGFAGLATCGSVWACPVCSAKVAAARQDEVGRAAAWWEAQGGALGFLTLTVSHKAHNSLRSVWDAISAGWHSITSGRAWKRNAETFGIEGWSRFIEVTHGENGWHVHVHVILFLHHALGQVDVAVASAALLGRWRSGIAKHGFRASDQHGADLRMLTSDDAAAEISRYVTKTVYRPSRSAADTAALEATRGDLKQTKGTGHRTPFGILADLVRSGDAEDLALWEEWERTSRGKRQMAWSKGLRELVQVLDVDELSDEDIAAEVIGTSADNVVILPGPTWRLLYWAAELLLEVAETRTAAVIHWLDDRGLDWSPPV